MWGGEPGRAGGGESYVADPGDFYVAVFKMGYPGLSGSLFITGERHHNLLISWTGCLTAERTNDASNPRNWKSRPSDLKRMSISREVDGFFH